MKRAQYTHTTAFPAHAVVVLVALLLLLLQTTLLLYKQSQVSLLQAILLPCESSGCGGAVSGGLIAIKCVTNLCLGCGMSFLSFRIHAVVHLVDIYHMSGGPKPMASLRLAHTCHPASIYHRKQCLQQSRDSLLNKRLVLTVEYLPMSLFSLCVWVWVGGWVCLPDAATALPPPAGCSATALLGQDPLRV